jgi:DNA glycosylase AlkZ-like
VDVVRHLLAVQSQDYPNAKWALAQRVEGSPTEGEIDRAFDAGEFVRTHVMRPTWHFVAAEDLRWLLALTAPRVRQASGYQYRQLGIDAEVTRLSRRAIENALVGGVTLTREELSSRLADAGIEATGLRSGYLIIDSELEGLICSGPRRGKRQTYALLEERLPPAPARTRDEALAELARRYVEGHGPAQVADVSWWSGLTIADARRALEAASPLLAAEKVGERSFWVSPSAPAVDADSPVVHLLPNYDELLIAFRDRSDAADSELPASARVAEVVLAHVVVRDGLVVGGYRRRDQRGSTTVAIKPMVSLDETELTGIRAAAERFAAFLEREVRLTGLD